MKRSKRILATVMLMLIPNAGDRVRFVKKHRLYGEIGEDVHIQSRVLPLHSELIHIHNNVKLASNVTFLTHDIIHKMLNVKYPEEHFVEKVGCIEIMDNVFIGAGTQIMYNTRIGTNVIIGSGSVVTKDIPDNSVYAGVPAKYICSFDEYVEKARKQTDLFQKQYGLDHISGMNDDLAKAIYQRFTVEKDNRS